MVRIGKMRHKPATVSLSRLSKQSIRFFTAGPHLKSFVKNYWLLETSRHQPAGFDFFLPDGGLGLLVNLGSHMELNSTLITQGIRLDGATSTIGRLTVPPGTRCLGIRFKPGIASAFLNRPVNSLINQPLTPSDLETSDGAFSNTSFHRLTDHDDLLTESVLLRNLDLLLSHHLTKVKASDLQQGIKVNELTGMLTKTDNIQSIEAFSKAAGFSRRQLERLFLKHTGVSPKQFLRLQQLYKARRALKYNPKQPVADIATSFGFYDQAHFSQAFKQVYRMTPGVYRKQEANTFDVDSWAS